jgi:transposase-like protein
MFVKRELLKTYLDRGLSLERIAVLAGKHPSTVGYWVQKHGLKAVGAETHAAKGGIPRDRLEALTREGLTTRGIAERVGLSQGTVRHWLRMYGLRTLRHRKPHGERGADPSRQTLRCQRHGVTEFWLEPRGIYRCLRCRSEAVTRRRRRVKDILVREAGGRCRLCGYDRHVGALQFHHLDTAAKVFGLADRGFTRSLEAARAEAAKCVLLCSNCHAEVEGGIVSLV